MTVDKDGGGMPPEAGRPKAGDDDASARQPGRSKRTSKAGAGRSGDPRGGRSRRSGTAKGATAGGADGSSAKPKTNDQESAKGKNGNGRAGTSSARQDKSTDQRAERPRVVEFPSIFHHRPLITGEKPEEYDLMLQALLDALKPKDEVDYILVYDIARYTWELMRAWKMRAEFIDSVWRGEAMVNAINVHTKTMPHRIKWGVTLEQREALLEATDAVARWRVGDLDAIGRIPGLQEAINRALSGGVPADTYVAMIERLEGLSRTIRMWESRRNQLIADLERRHDRRHQRVMSSQRDLWEFDHRTAADRKKPSVQ